MRQYFSARLYVFVLPDAVTAFVEASLIGVETVVIKDNLMFPTPTTIYTKNILKCLLHFKIEKPLFLIQRGSGLKWKYHKCNLINCIDDWDLQNTEWIVLKFWQQHNKNLCFKWFSYFPDKHHNFKTKYYVSLLS